MANDENLIPQNQRTKKEQREIAKKGGIASGKSRREKKRFAEIYSKVLEKKYKAENERGKIVEASGYQLLEATILKILRRGDSSSVSLIKELREGLDGIALEITGKNGGPIENINMTSEMLDKLSAEELESLKAIKLKLNADT